MESRLVVTWRDRKGWEGEMTTGQEAAVGMSRVVILTVMMASQVYTDDRIYQILYFCKVYCMSIRPQ